MKLTYDDDVYYVIMTAQVERDPLVFGVIRRMVECTPITLSSMRGDLIHEKKH